MPEVNKSQAIRDYYKLNPKAKTSEVVDALAKKGITVTANLVTTVKSAHNKKLAAKRAAQRQLVEAKGVAAVTKNAGAKPEVNKSQAVRDFLKANRKATNKEVAEALTAKGIAVNANYVATIKTHSKKRRKAVKTVVASTGLNIAQIKAAFRFIKECGDTAAAKAALSAADDLKKLAVV